MTTRPLLVLMLIWLFPLSLAGAAEAYRCVDPDGLVSYSDQPCGEGVAQRRVDTAPPPTAIPAEPVVTTPFTVGELLRRVATYRPHLLIFFGTLPLLAALLLPFSRGPRGGPLPRPVAHLYSLLIYLVTIPGVFALLLIGYSIFFLHQNLLEVDLFIYLLPVVSMVLTLVLIAKATRIGQLPGVDGIVGLVTLLTVTFFALFLLYKMRIWVVFVGSLQALVVIGVVLFLLLHWGWGKLSR